MPTATPAQHQTKRREPWPTEITVIAMQDPVVDLGEPQAIRLVARAGVRAEDVDE